MSDIRRIKIEMLNCPFGTGRVSAVIDVAGTSTLIDKFNASGLSPCHRACELIDAALIQQGKATLTEYERKSLVGRAG